MTSSSHALAAPGASLERVPHSWRVYEGIRRRIEDREYPVRSFLPPEAELCALLSVSRTTICKAGRPPAGPVGREAHRAVDNYLVSDAVPGLEAKVERIQSRSLHASLEAEYDLSLDAATDFITARAATADEAAPLRTPPGSPLLVVRRIPYAGDRPIERADLRIVASRYQYSVHTFRRPRGASVTEIEETRAAGVRRAGTP